MCALSGKPILVGRSHFYLFPCGHVFDAGALANEVLNTLQPMHKLQLETLLNRLASLSAPGSASPTAAGAAADGGFGAASKAGEEPAGPTLAQQRDEAQAEVDEFIAAECPFCGEAMVRRINAPFIAVEDAREAAEWAIPC